MDVLDRDYRPRFALGFGRLLDRITRIWFRFEMRHAARIPKETVLFVGNHSGIGITDVLCLMGAASTVLGPGRRAVGMMHKMFVTAPIVGHVSRAFGAVPADPTSARAALARGWDVVSFPGGDIDACRPWYEARQVQFGNRRGYVRLALEADVPIVPLATLGSHRTYTLLPGGATIARVTGMKAWARCERFPLVLGTVLGVVVLALALASLVPWWAVAIALVALLVPNPARVTTEVLPPIDVAKLTAHIADREERIEAAHALVHEALTRAVATMQHGEPTVATSRKATG